MKPKALTESEKVELLSEDVQEILGRVPPWITRRGITIIFVLVAGLVAGSFFFKYPDVIVATAVIISENPPATIVARTAGKIDHLFVENEEKVTAGEVLAVLESTSDYRDIQKVKGEIERVAALLDTPAAVWPGLSGELTLGSLQPAYADLYRKYQEFEDFKANDLTGKKILSIQNQIQDYTRYLHHLNEQVGYKEKVLRLSHRQFARDSLMYAKDLIALTKFEDSETAYLQGRNDYQGLLATVSNSRMQINQLRYQVIDLQTQKTGQTQQFVNALREALDNLKTGLAEWERSYLLRSSIAGTVTFTKVWSRNQVVTAGQDVFSVVPDRPQQIIGRAYLPVTGAGKVETGQRVNIRVDNFPYQEFGMLEGKVESISLVPETNAQGTFYIVKLSLPGGLTTSYKKTLAFSQEMPGSVDFITKDLSLIERFIQPLRAVLNKSGY